MLAHILRTDRRNAPGLLVVSEQGRSVIVLARRHQEAIWAINQVISPLQSALLELFPQAL